MILYVLIEGLLVVASAKYLESDGNRQVNLGDLSMQNPDLVGGDMLGVDLNPDRTAIRYLNYRWKWNQIPYKIDSSLKQYTDLIRSAMDEYHNKTCLRFIPYDRDSNYVYIFPGDGCYSFVGMVGGGQQLSLGEGCMYKGIILHELGHVVGFFHEHMRSDRDNYLTIYWENIEAGMHNQFEKVQPFREILLTPFDYTSIMIYDNKAFSKDGSVTMEAKTGVPLLRPALKTELSADDVTRINKMYYC